MSAKKKGTRAKEPTCRHCDCKPDSREVCAKHAADGNQMIRMGIYTDEELVEKGYWAEAKPSGRPTKVSKVVAELVRAKTGRK